MKKHLLFVVLLFCAFASKAQTNVITDGSFESSPWYAYWSFPQANGDLWGGSGSCGAFTGSKYIWLGDQNEYYGVNYGVEEMYQTVTVPSNATSCTLNLYASINTLEGNTTVYDYVEVSIKSTSGALLYSLGNINNTQGDYGIPGCQTWTDYYAVVPAQYFGQTFRLCFDFYTDGSNPTIFRMDNISLNYYTTAPCTYTLSQYNYTAPSAAANTYGNVTLVNTQAGCNWTAGVTSGSGWMTTSSSGSGSGGVTITVTENTSTAPRTGTINVNGEILTVTQPGASCTYSLSQSSYTCFDYLADTYNNIALVNTGSGCSWDAVVLVGTSWMNTSSIGTGNGAVSINVLENNTAFPRTGTIEVEGQTITVTQPANPWLTGVEEVQDAFRIYPNPVEDILTLEVGSNYLNSRYVIVDQCGRTVHTGVIANTRASVDLSGLAAGMYTLLLGDAKQGHKLIRK